MGSTIQDGPQRPVNVWISSYQVNIIMNLIDCQAVWLLKVILMTIIYDLIMSEPHDIKFFLWMSSTVQLLLTFDLWVMAHCEIFNIGWLVDKVSIYDMKGQWMFAIDSSIVKFMLNSVVFTLSSFAVGFENVINWLGGQNWYGKSI